jgi:hypothetical protein
MLMSVTAAGQPGEAPRLASERAWAGWALRWWETFPVGLRPRPLVMTGPLTIVRGFRSGEAKLAFQHGDIDAAVPLPDGLLEALRENHDDPISAAERRHWKTPLLITHAQADRAEFSTDRGRRELPAWRLTGPEVDGPFWILDQAIASQRWTPPAPAPEPPFDRRGPHRAGSALIEDSGLVLHFTFAGAPPEYAEYPSAEVIETDQAVVVLPVERDIGPPGPRFAVGYGRTVIANLARPLGDRVLIDLDASPVMVVEHNPT